MCSSDLADGLGQMGLACAWRPHEEHVAGVVEELAGGQLEELPAGERGVEVPVELVKGFEISEAGELGAAVELAVIADGHFVLEDELEELEMAQAAGLGLLESDIEGPCESGEAEVSEGRAEVVVHEIGRAHV